MREKWQTARPSLISSGLPVALGVSANGLTRENYSRCGTVHLENVPPVGQRGSVMICLFSDRKIRRWQKKVFSVVSGNHYHWACLWHAGRNNHQKGNDEKIASPSRPQHSPEIFGSPSRLIGTALEMRRNLRPARRVEVIILAKIITGMMLGGLGLVLLLVLMLPICFSVVMFDWLRQA